jgi:hypothetical protein
VFGVNGNPVLDVVHPVRSVFLLFVSRTFYLADNSAEGALVVDMESFFSFAIETKKHPTRFAMPPVSSAGMTLWADGHIYSPFTARWRYTYL